jgi:LPS-assembly protein
MLMEGEFRYLTKSSEGQFGAAYLNDEIRSQQADRLRKNRYMYNWQHKGGLDSRVMTRLTTPRSAIRTTSRTCKPIRSV